MTTTCIFAENAWLGPGRFARRVLVEFDTHLRRVTDLTAGAPVPDGCCRVSWLIPGLVNAHCHLEYSWLAGQLPRGDIPFGQWMNAIMARRPASAEDQSLQKHAMAEAAHALIRGGCTTVLDSTTDGASEPPLTAAGLRFFLFREVLGLSAGRAEPLWRAAVAAVTVAPSAPSPSASSLLGAGLNPHAPYSVGPWLRERLASETMRSLPLAWHLAETPDEEALFQYGTGSIAEQLTAFGLPLPTNEFGRSSFDFLAEEGLLEPCDLAFHGNELSPDAASFFRAPRGLVHCPGTHRWFQRRPAPLRQWLDAGVNVCLGTDSLASADSLSMLDLAKITLDDNPDLTPDDVLTMACVNPWKLGFLRAILPEATGTIVPGAPADLVALTPGPGGMQVNPAASNPFYHLDPAKTTMWRGGHRLT